MALCWICSTEEGTTGEHIAKRSDIKAVLGATGPLHLHNRQRRNIKLQSLNARKLKSTAPMCNTCNSARTQPYDYAWEALSEALRLRRPALKHGDIVRTNRIFLHNTAKQMLNVHLFFVKWLGCQYSNQSLDCLLFGGDRESEATSEYLAFFWNVGSRRMGWRVRCWCGHFRR